MHIPTITHKPQRGGNKPAQGRAKSRQRRSAALGYRQTICTKPSQGGTTLAYLLLLVGLILPLSTAAAAEEHEKPFCTIAVVSNPYITALKGEQLGKRTWLEKTAPAGLSRAVAAVNQLQPDAFVILGSLTWSGSDADFELFRSHLDRIQVPVHVAAGPNDVKDGGRERYDKHVSKWDVAGQSLNVGGVLLQFPDGDSDRKQVDSLQETLTKTGDARGVLLFGGPDFPAPDENTADDSDRGRFWRLIHRHKVAARVATAHAHYLTYADSLPNWAAPSTGWSYSPKWDVGLISVFPEKVEFRLVRAGEDPDQTLTVPNPAAAPRMKTDDDDPFGLPTYSRDLALKPQLTFAQLSDSQFDDGTVPRYAQRFHYDEQMNQVAVEEVNRLGPAMVFMTGDLTNKNTPTEWETFGRIYSKLKPPFYPVPGNHDTLYDRDSLTRKALGDLYEPGLKNWQFADKLAGKKTDDRTALFRHFTGKQPYFTVEEDNCAFICLYTGVASVDSEQMKWFREELERTKSADHVFVLGHYPLLKEYGGNIQGPEAAEILSLLRQYRVAAYLAGHRHRYDYRLHEGTAHVLCDDLCWGEYCAYQIYHVFPDRIVACWKPIFRAAGNRPLYERVTFPEPRYRAAKNSD